MFVLVNLKFVVFGYVFVCLWCLMLKFIDLSDEEILDLW